MKKRKWTIVVLLLILSIVGVGVSKSRTKMDKDRKSKLEQSPNYKKGKFQNLVEMDKFNFSKTMRILKNYITDSHPEKFAKVEFPIDDTPWNFDSKSDFWFSWLGHSTVFMSLEGKNILVDPVISKRASFVQWMGPKRMHPFPVDVKTIPDLDMILISHDHYDHLDKHAMKEFADRTKYIIVPLGVGQHLEDWGVSPDKIVELDWWDVKNVGDIQVTLTPGRHSSGRGLMDQDETFWGGYAIKSDAKNIYYSGDTGFFDYFEEIGDRLGPFDMSLMQVGAYNEEWSSVHMFPEEAVEAQKMVKADVMLPLHWGTFDLALHSWYDPAVRVKKAMDQEGMKVVFPKLGEQVNFENIDTQSVWWKEFVPDSVYQVQEVKREIVLEPSLLVE
ncbi:MBL fold metallo-hydrolase [Aureibacter tunicatorum]|uniref:L-ascorbate metabolism protein UlaG (Beta-lactamase superfamily) n=1 Tax=Aureibacter tunicatorum TaxID=866807 RepID=A0AAE3XJA0_9BACT|nr:MBL fold metallo-hydrolase [Aureibacter tunicatorum]MDR6237902.1 L-ascorbate metabolism protein UlaG (beta-lactamase superfamily) [Aureibacter tunicatorum]BDD02935.1 hydrolase [Aureibacter tunicatorum]